MNSIDHVHHGWALLAMRLPGLRSVTGSAYRLSEMFECYSLTVLHLQKLRREQAPDSAIIEYDELRCGIEDEVAYYMAHQSKRAG